MQQGIRGKRIAVIGAGIAGLSAAWLLARQHAETLFEANDYLGGHTHTVDVTLDGVTAPVDTGFLVFTTQALKWGMRVAGLKRGVTVEGVRYGPIDATVDRQQGSNCWLIMTLTEGKNREIRRVLEHLGLQVNRLIRIAYGPFQLGDLPAAACVEVSPKALAEQLDDVVPALRKKRS